VTEIAVADTTAGRYSSTHDEQKRVFPSPVSVVHERSALGHPGSLFEHAQRLHRLAPDGPLPDGGRPFPDSGDRPRVPYSERRRALAAVLREFTSDPALAPQDLHERCTHLAIKAPDVTKVLQDLAPEPSRRLLQTGRWLAENGTDRRAVLVGLGLLRGHAEPRDAPLLKVIGLLCFAGRVAVETLAGIPGAEQDLIWLADRSRGHTRVLAVQALAGRQDPAIRDWVLSTPRELLSSELARRLAEEHDIAGALGQPVVDDALWDQAGSLLLALTSTGNYRYEIDRYEQAPLAYQRWVALAASRPVALDRAALLVMVAEDLATGPAAPVLGDLRASLIDQVNSVLAAPPWAEMLSRGARSGDPVEARRAAWVIAAAPAGIPEEQFAVRVVVPDPRPDGFPLVEARIVIDGMPVVAASFSKGPAEAPEELLNSGRLRAGSEPREVKLAEAYCTEGCCGALYVTIVREGDEVVWKDWRSPVPGDQPREARFGAAAYDREVSRAEQDHGWEWPARTVARLLTDQLRADPSILSRWDCRAGWCTAWLKDFDTARLTFAYPARMGSSDAPYIQFGLVAAVGDRNPQALTAQIIESMRHADPRTTAEMIGGSKDSAEKLGLTYRKPIRW
jgi:hypothetical protein